MTVDEGETDEGSEEIQETKMALVREAGLKSASPFRLGKCYF